MSLPDQKGFLVACRVTPLPAQGRHRDWVGYLGLKIPGGGVATTSVWFLLLGG